MTCAPSTDDRGEGLLTWFRAGFPVPTSVQQEEVQESTASSQDSGRKWPASLAKYDPATCSWKTPQFSLLGGLASFSETWPRWGLMRDGECWERIMSVLPISAIASGLWPTPVANDDNKTPAAHLAMKLRMGERDGTGANRTAITSLQVAAKAWSTPCTPNGGRVNRPEDILSNGTRSDGTKVQVSLESEARAWATPQSRDHFPAHSAEYVEAKKAQGHGMRNLNDEAANWATPNARDHKGPPGKGCQERGGHQSDLGAMVKSSLGKTASRGSLNPDFHLWLMGWPEGWNVLEPLGMDRFQRWLHSHGVC